MLSDEGQAFASKLAEDSNDEVLKRALSEMTGELEKRRLPPTAVAPVAQKSFFTLKNAAIGLASAVGGCELTHDTRLSFDPLRIDLTTLLASFVFPNYRVHHQGRRVKEQSTLFLISSDPAHVSHRLDFHSQVKTS